MQPQIGFFGRHSRLLDRFDGDVYEVTLNDADFFCETTPAPPFGQRREPDVERLAALCVAVTMTCPLNFHVSNDGGNVSVTLICAKRDWESVLAMARVTV